MIIKDLINRDINKKSKHIYKTALSLGIQVYNTCIYKYLLIRKWVAETRLEKVLVNYPSSITSGFFFCNHSLLTQTQGVNLHLCIFCVQVHIPIVFFKSFLGFLSFMIPQTC